jgi:hypothetical protein
MFHHSQSYWLFIAITLFIKSFSFGEKVASNTFSCRRSSYANYDNLRPTNILDIKVQRSSHKYVDRDLTPQHGKLWPPWPFNLIGKENNVKITSEKNSPTTSSRFIAYLRQSSRIGIRQIQQRKLLSL